MATIQLFRGTRRVLLGDEFVSGEFIEVDAERVGGVWEEYDARGGVPVRRIAPSLFVGGQK